MPVTIPLSPSVPHGEEISINTNVQTPLLPIPKGAWEKPLAISTPFMQPEVQLDVISSTSQWPALKFTDQQGKHRIQQMLLID